MDENFNGNNLSIVQFSTKLSLSDYSKAFMINLIFKQKKVWERIFIFIVILSGIFYFILPNPFIFSISIPLIWFTGYLFWLRHNFISGIEKNKINFEKVNWDVHRDFMHGVAETFETNVEFKEVARFFYKGGYYIIFSLNRNFVFIPKRQLSKDKIDLFNDVMRYNNKR
jgi:hypothetical protein